MYRASLAGFTCLALLASCGGGGPGTRSVASHPERVPPATVTEGDGASPPPRTGELVALADLGVLRGRCPYDGPARLVYTDRSGTGIDVRAQVGDRPPVHQVPSASSDRFRMFVPRDGAGFVPVHLVIATVREPEKILATVYLRLSVAPTVTHPSGCGLGHVRVDIATHSNSR